MKTSLVAALFLCLSFFIPLAVSQTCPECASPSVFIPISNGHGTGPNGGRIVTICFDTSAQVDNNLNPTPGRTNPGLWNGLGAPGAPAPGAIQYWNQSLSGYYLQYDCSNPDISVGVLPHTTTGGFCGQSSNKYSLFNGKQLVGSQVDVSDWLAQSVNPADIIWVFAHELGHVFGLEDATRCGATVMGGHFSSGAGKQCLPQYPVNSGTPLRANDVTAARNVINGSAQCTALDWGNNNPNLGGGVDLGTCLNVCGSECMDEACPITGETAFCSGGTISCLSACKQWCGLTCMDDLSCPDGEYPQCEDNDGGIMAVCYNPNSPIVIDSFGEGFHLTNIPHGVRFRIRPSGPSYKLSWLDQDFHNGWLALDRNGNGTIDDFSELFGNFTAQPSSPDPNGYRALAVFDDKANGGNGNGVIDSGDSVFSHLRIWIDENHDGVSQASELHTLPELGVFRIDLHYERSSYMDAHGNQFRYQGKIWDEAGREHQVCYDVFLKVAPSRIK